MTTKSLIGRYNSLFELILVLMCTHCWEPMKWESGGRFSLQCAMSDGSLLCD